MRRKIPLLRGWAILAVVLHHATNRGFLAMFWWVHRYRSVAPPNYDQVGSFSYYALTTVNQVAMFSVPAFLFISGLFTAYVALGPSATVSWKVIRTRLLSLLWPYLIWSVGIFVLDGILGEMHSPTEYLIRLLTGGAVGAYFFVPLLAQFYLLSPFLVRWAKTRPRLLLFLSALLQLVMVVLPYVGGLWTSPVAVQRAFETLDWVFIRWVLFFVLGVVVGLHRKLVKEWLARRKWQLLTATILVGGLSVLESQLIYQSTSDWDWAYTPLKLSSVLYALIFILAFLAQGVRPSVHTRTIEKIGKISYGIYLIHPKAVELTSRAIYHIAPALLAHQLVLTLLLFLLVLGGCWSLMTIVARSPAPGRVYRYLFG